MAKNIIRKKNSKTNSTQAEVINLTPKQEKFCQLYATQIEFFGNGVASYMEAYNLNPQLPASYGTARTNASRMLTNANILDRINELLEQQYLNDSHVDKQLAFWINQKASPQAALAAIKEYNALKQRITEKKRLEIEGLKNVALVEFIDAPVTSEEDTSQDS